MFNEEYAGYELASSWAGLVGHWEFEGADAQYTEPQDANLPIGLAVCNLSLRAGWIEADVHLGDPKTAGRLVFGHDAASSSYFSAGVGGDLFAYYIDAFVSGQGWRPVVGQGASDNLNANHAYHVETYVSGQHVSMSVDGVPVASAALPGPLPGAQVGVIAWGQEPVQFSNVRTIAEQPEAFVVMQFGEPYDGIYNDVIVPVALEMGYLPRRADDVYSPGIILQDIISGLVRASVVIAEITPRNPNVFYELGYSHALEKPTILLAERDRQLPFDVSGYRCIFYDNTIAGKRGIEENLRRHLASISSGS